jgi:hypothetical protein
MRTTWVLVLAGLCVCVGGAEAKRLRLHRPKHAVQLRMTPFHVPPQTDREGCEVLVMPNRKPMDVAAFELNASGGTHHFVLWEYLGKHRNPADFWNGVEYSAGCVGLGPQDGFYTTANLFGMQFSHARVEFPPGIAVRLSPGAIVYPDLHIRNYGTTPMTADAVFNLIPAKKGSVKHYAQSLSLGTFNIEIPAHSSASFTGEWHPSVPLNFIQVSTHEHHLGTSVSVHRVDAHGADMGELVLTTDWEHPAEEWFTQPMRLENGEGIRFTCDWENPQDHAVTFGVTTQDEMCFATGYFYTDDDSVPTGQPGCLPQGAGLECFVQ